MNQRQEFALLNPLNTANGMGMSAYRAVRTERGLLLMSVLAVDR